MGELCDKYELWDLARIFCIPLRHRPAPNHLMFLTQGTTHLHIQHLRQQRLARRARRFSSEWNWNNRIMIDLVTIVLDG